MLEALYREHGPALLPRRQADQLGERMDLFELSPDERFLSVPGGKGEVAVLDLTDNKIYVVQDNVQGERELRLPPVWRSAGELCFVGPPGGEHASKDRGEVVLWSLDEHGDPKYRVLSKDWPQAAVERWLTRREKKPTTRPAPSPKGVAKP
jgi:hypothetical protein